MRHSRRNLRVAGETMEERIARSTFSTAGIDPRLRARTCATWLRPIAKVDFAADAAIHVSAATLSIGDVTIALTTSSPARYARTEDVIRASPGRDGVLVQRVVKGSVYADLGHKSIDLAAGDVFLLDLSARCEVWVDDCECVHLLIPRGYLHKVIRAIHGRTLRAGSLAGRMLAEQLACCGALLRSEDTVKAAGTIHATIDLLVQCLGATLERGGAEERGAATREAVLRYIEQHLSSPELGFDQLAMRFGLSRAALYRLFVEFGGVQHYIRDRRLDAVLRDICQRRDLSISAAAHRYGFSNDRQFQRAFRARFGTTAKNARAGWRIERLSQHGRR
jgi:AraC-like DNA-binding protein